MAKGVKPVVTQAAPARAVPATQPYVAPNGKERAVLLNTQTGKRTPMSKQYAERRARKFPNIYKVV